MLERYKYEEKQNMLDNKTILTMKKEIVFWLLPCCLVVLLYSCRPKTCIYEMAKMISSIRTMENDSTFYLHYVLVKGLDRSCMDSLQTIAMLKNYISENPQKDTIAGILLFDSDEDFDGSGLSQPSSFFENQILTVYFNIKTHEPKEFEFYNSAGVDIYDGDRWNGW